MAKAFFLVADAIATLLLPSRVNRDGRFGCRSSKRIGPQHGRVRPLVTDVGYAGLSRSIYSKAATVISYSASVGGGVFRLCVFTRVTLHSHILGGFFAGINRGSD